MFCINKTINHPFSNKIIESIIPKIVTYENDKGYVLNFSRAKKRKEYCMYYNKMIEENKSLRIKGLTKKIEKKFYSNSRCPEDDHNYEKSSKSNGKRIHKELFNYVMKNKKISVTPHTQVNLKLI